MATLADADCFKKIKLRDGIHVTFRPLLHSDKKRMLELFSSFSPQTVYFRFMGPMSVMTDQALEHYLDNDFIHAVAIVATIQKAGREHIIAVARYYADEKDRTQAEFAIVVQDGWQKKGVGTKLMQHLCSVAKGRGVNIFHALVFKENASMLKLAEKLGFPLGTRKFDEDTMRVELWLGN